MVMLVTGGAEAPAVEASAPIPTAETASIPTSNRRIPRNDMGGSITGPAWWCRVP